MDAKNTETAKSDLGTTQIGGTPLPKGRENRVINYVSICFLK